VKRLNLNHSSQQELEAATGLVPARARYIVEARPIRSWDELSQTEGFTAEIVQALRARGARLGDPETAEMKSLSEEHERALARARKAAC
jgi:hypothetical protein